MAENPTSKFNKETTPIPTNTNLEVTIIPEGYFAVLQFSGRSSDKNFESAKNLQFFYLVIESEFHLNHDVLAPPLLID